MGELEDKISSVLNEYNSRELIDERTIIQYVIQTTCAYCLDMDGKISPNGSKLWTGLDEYQWHNGTAQQDATHRHPFGFSVYARAHIKKTYQFKTGKIEVEYEKIHDDGEKTMLNRLNAFPSLRPPRDGKIEEIDFTEDSAEFFVNLLESVCKLNEKIKDRLDPKSIKQIIDNKQKLLD